MKNIDYKKLYIASVKMNILNLPEEYEYIKDYFNVVEDTVKDHDRLLEDIGSYHEQVTEMKKEISDELTEMTNFINANELLKGTRAAEILLEKIENMENLLWE